MAVCRGTVPAVRSECRAALFLQAAAAPWEQPGSTPAPVLPQLHLLLKISPTSYFGLSPSQGCSSRHRAQLAAGKEVGRGRVLVGLVDLGRWM